MTELANQTTAPLSSTEKRQFNVHPAIIKTLINEQAGSFIKAIGELAMNAADAGATEIIMTINGDGYFTFSDNGSGFCGRSEIETFFETFGTPHEDGDSQYGRFAIGRGQIMSFARTKWRSGHFEMLVDLDGEKGFFGYDLIEHKENHLGCEITGEIYNKKESFQLSDFMGWDDESPDQSEFAKMVKFVNVPIFVNGHKINTPATEVEWTFEDDAAWYGLNRTDLTLDVYNCGVMVKSYWANKFGVGGIVNSKKALAVNLARNSILEHKCDVWMDITKAIKKHFSIQIHKISRLKEAEMMALIEQLISDDIILDGDDITRIRKLKFIPDPFGNYKSPDEYLTADKFTFFDGVSTTIAERIQRESLASVVMPKLLKMAKLKEDDRTAIALLQKLKGKLYAPTVFNFIPFNYFLSKLNSTSRFIDEADYTEEERIVMDCLKVVNAGIAKLVNGPQATTRTLRLGESDTMLGWTDGLVFIAISRQMIRGIKEGTLKGKTKGSGAAGLINILIHEYAHVEVTQGDHVHDVEFYERFHNAVMNNAYSPLLRDFYELYVAGILLNGVKLAGPHKNHINRLMKFADGKPA